MGFDCEPGHAARIVRRTGGDYLCAVAPVAAAPVSGARRVGEMRTASLLLGVVCAMRLFVSAQAAPQENADTTIRALEHAWFEGESRSDNRALDQIFDNGLVYIENGKSFTKGEYLAQIRSAGPHPEQVVMETMSVRMFGRAAIVVGSYREKSGNDGKTQVRRWRFVDTWVNKKGRWLLVAAAAAPLSR